MGKKSDEEIREAFSELVQSGMQAQDLSLRELAGLADITPSYLSRILRGIQGPPSESKIRKIAEVLQIEPAERLLAAAGRFPDSRPQMVPLLRAAGSLSDEDLAQVMEVVKRLSRNNRKTGGSDK